VAWPLRVAESMKPILRTSALFAFSTFVALSGSLRADETASSPTQPAPAGSPGSTDSKNQENTPAGPTAQGDTGTTGTPQQTKTQDGAVTDKQLSNGSPNEATKKHHKKKHHHVVASSSAASQTNPVPSPGM